MTVFVYEWCVALGLGRDESDPAHSLFREGKAMWDAVADDFRRQPGVEVVTLDSVGEAEERTELTKLATRADWTVVIAPEFDRILAERCRWVRNAGGRPLNPSRAGINLTSDKYLLCLAWERSGVRTPITYTSDYDWAELTFPLVCKPIDGAGSTNTAVIFDEEALVQFFDTVEGNGGDPYKFVVQPFVPGRAASVAFLVGPNEALPLIPAFQVLSSDGHFRYEGGELPIPPALAERAVALGRRAVACVPGLLGYVGVDLVLGDAADGSADYAIEINPRLTTSYVGLRALADFNLAGAMLRAAAGEPVPPPRWHPGRIRFRPDGTVTRLPATEPAFF